MLIDINTDLSERVKYNITGLPIYLQCSFLSSYPNYAAEKHWHDDLEFIYIKSGKMQYNINSEIVNLNTGDGIFINAKQFHFGFSNNNEECEFTCILIHPVILCVSQYIEQNYVMPILNDVSLSYHILHRNIDWENNILKSLSEIMNCGELKTISLFYEIWENLCKHKQLITNKQTIKNSKLNTLKYMISFIQANYNEKITLLDIAKAGSVGKTECCTVFQKYTNLTPILYLNDFRLRKSVEFLSSTDMTITEICYEVGFSGTSYFCEMFKKTFLCSPKEYRKKN